MNLLDGVTTQLDMEAGAFPVSFFGQDYKDGAPAKLRDVGGALCSEVKGHGKPKDRIPFW